MLDRIAPFASLHQPLHMPVKTHGRMVSGLDRKGAGPSPRHRSNTTPMGLQHLLALSQLGRRRCRDDTKRLSPLIDGEGPESPVYR